MLIVIIRLELYGTTYVSGGIGTIPLKAVTSKIMLTQYGLNYMESKMGDPTYSGEEKVNTITKRVTEWGYNELKDIAVKVAADLIRGSIPQ